MKLSNGVRMYVFPNGAKLLISKNNCRVVPNFGGGHVGVDITREEAVEALQQLRSYNHGK